MWASVCLTQLTQRINFHSFRQMFINDGAGGGSSAQHSLFPSNLGIEAKNAQCGQG